MKIWIKGAGDLATGIGIKLHRCGFRVVMTELPVPTTVRRTVAFSRAVYEEEALVEDVTGRLCHSFEEIDGVLKAGNVAVVVDEEGRVRDWWKPDVVVDAIIAKRNMGTGMTDAPTVIGVGPGFTAGQDCHCVVETLRGHNLGRCIWKGCAAPNTGVPGMVGGYAAERLLRAAADGSFTAAVKIGDMVKQGDIVGYAGGVPVKAQIDGIVRGLLQDGVPVTKGMKAGDVDARCERENCFSVSDKANAIGGGVLEAVLRRQTL